MNLAALDRRVGAEGATDGSLSRHASMDCDQNRCAVRGVLCLIATNVSSAGSADRSPVPWWRGLDPPKGPAYSAISWKVKSVAGAVGSRSMPKSRGRKPKKPRAPTKGAPKQLIAHNTPPREPPIPAQTVQQEPSIPPQTVQQESSIPRQTLLQSILKSVKRAWVRLVTQRGSFT
jgi:hypothetical protein